MLTRSSVSSLGRCATIASVIVLLASPLPAQEVDATSKRHHPRGNAVIDWNTVATDAFTPSQGTNPMAQSRTLAILHAAMHDALNAIDPRFAPYTAGIPRARRGVDRGSRRGGRPRRARDLAARSDVAGGDGVCAGPGGSSRGTGQGGRHRHRPGCGRCEPGPSGRVTGSRRRPSPSTYRGRGPGSISSRPRSTLRRNRAGAASPRSWSTCVSTRSTGRSPSRACSTPSTWRL